MIFCHSEDSVCGGFDPGLLSALQFIPAKIAADGFIVSNSARLIVLIAGDRFIYTGDAAERLYQLYLIWIDTQINQQLIPPQ